MKFRFFIFSLLVSISAFGQHSTKKVIELAISYDQSYKDLSDLHTDGNVITRIDEVMQIVNRIYGSQNLEFRIVSIENFGNVVWKEDPNQQITAAWLNGDDLCYRRDMVLHLTGEILGGPENGSAATNKALCNSNSSDYLDHNQNVHNYVLIAEFRNIYWEAKTIAHEIGHGLNLGHETLEVCYSNPTANSVSVMCPFDVGPNPNEETNFFFGPENISELQEIVNSDIFDCLDVDNYDPNIECTDISITMEVAQQINSYCPPDWLDVTITLKNDETPRTFPLNMIRFKPFDDLIFSQEIQDLEVASTQGNATSLILENQFTLGANEKKVYNFQMSTANIVGEYLGPIRSLVQIDVNFRNVDPPLDGQDNANRNIHIGRSIQDVGVVLEDGYNVTNLQDEITALEASSFRPPEKYYINVNGTFIIDQDLELDERYEFVMGENARIEVSNNSTFNYMSGLIKPCKDERWDNILVHPGSNINLQNTRLIRGKRGVELLSGSSSLISEANFAGCTFEDFTYGGVKLSGKAKGQFLNNNFLNVGNTAIELREDVDITMFMFNNIDGVNTGIKVTDNPNLLHITEENNVSNAQSGIVLVRSSAIINKANIDVSDFGLVLIKSDATELLSSIITSDFVGCDISSSQFLTIKDNVIGTAEKYGIYGMALFDVKNSSIKNNTEIMASRYAITGMQLLDVDIYRNTDISISGNYGVHCGAVKLTGANECDIKDNFIYATAAAFGIEINNASSNEVNNNLVSISPQSVFNRSAAIQLLATINDDIKENETHSNGYGQGIQAQNATAGLYECNYIYDTQKALAINHNSESQVLKTNHKINASEADFITYSVLGRQIHEGNEFWGGTAIANMEMEDVLASQFLVNENEPYHMPSNPMPAEGWFIPENQNDEECSGIVGPGSQISFFLDPTQLCAYWARIKMLKAENGLLYYTKLYHILRFYQVMELPLPECIKLDQEYISVCGLEKVAELTVMLLTSGKDRPAMLNSYEQMISNYRMQYDSITSLGSRDSIYREIKDLYSSAYPYYKELQAADSLRYDSISTALAGVVCLDSTAVLLRDTWLSYIDFIKNPSISKQSSVSPYIEEVSNLCSDRYGDAVHLARSIAAYHGSTTYYDENDGCLDIPISLRKKEAGGSTPLTMQVMPNPSVGSYEVVFSQQTSGTLILMDMQGREIASRLIKDATHISFKDQPVGVYIANFVSDQGEVVTQKVVVVL